MSDIERDPVPDEEVPEDLAEDVGEDLAGHQREPRPEIAGQERVAGVLPAAIPVDEEPVPDEVRGTEDRQA